MRRTTNGMNRKTIKTRTGAYHVTLPIRLVEEFDNVLSFKESRSKRIALLMTNYLAREDSNLQMMTSYEVFEFMQYRFKKDSPEDVLIQSLIRLTSQKPDEQSS